MVIKKLVIPISDGFKFIEINSILYCQAQGSYSNIFLINESIKQITQNLKCIESQLSKEFFLRIHKSYLVNINYIKEYHRHNGPQLTMVNGVTLPISRRRKDNVLVKLGIA